MVTAVVLAGCSSSNSGSGSSDAAGGGLPATIPVTLIADKTGVQAFYGTQLEAGVKAGVDYVNSTGMLGSSKIELTVQDTGSNASTATTLVSSAVRTKIPLLLGPSLSNEALATTPIAQSAKMPYLVDTAPPGVLDAGDYIYCTTTPQSSQVDALVAGLSKRLKTVSIIYANDNPTMNSLGPQVGQAFTAAGTKVDTQIGTAIAATDYSAVVTKAIANNPDGVGVISGGPMIPSVTKALRNAGYQGQIFGPEGADGTIDSAGAAANGFQFTSEWAPDLPGQVNKDFQAKMASLYPQLSIHYPAVDGFTEVLFAALALKQAQSVSPQKVLTGLQQVAGQGFDGPGGAIKFGDKGNRQLLGPAVLVEFNNGKTSRVQGS